MIVKIEGLDDLQKILRKMPGAAEKAAMNQIEKAATDLQGKAQMLAPVDMGDLRGSAFTEVQGMEATVGFAEPYALKQHETIGYRHPRGGQAKYLEQPYKENLKKYVNSIGDAIRRAVEKWR
jgi:hypothetical protein